MFTKFIKNIYASIIEARRVQAAHHTARALIALNPDFKHFSEYDLAQSIIKNRYTEKGA